MARRCKMKVQFDGTAGNMMELLKFTGGDKALTNGAHDRLAIHIDKFGDEVLVLELGDYVIYDRGFFRVEKKAS
jgi:hypothetical protein